jgi:7-carboxy-7-deazaguanine synthase
MDIGDIVQRVAGFNCATVCVTGGEPLAQKACLPLLVALCDAGHSVSLETSGALDIGGVDPRVSRVVDLKAPGSGEEAKNRWKNLDLLTSRDELKLVLASREDYDWAVAACSRHGLFERCPVLFSPVQGQLDSAQLAQWILNDRLPARFQLQLHKVLWGSVQGR